MKKKMAFFVFLLIFMICAPIISIFNKKNIPDNFVSAAEEPKKNQKQEKKKPPEKEEKMPEKFKILDNKTGEIFEVPTNEFLYGVLAEEMPPSFEEEALKAQAVAAYTYFLRQKKAENSKGSKHDISIKFEHWNGYKPLSDMKNKWGEKYYENSKKIKKAVDSILGEVLEDDGEPILAVYHAMSSGKTEKNKDVFCQDLKYLTNVASEGDKYAPGFETTVEISKDDFKKALKNKWDDCEFSSNLEEWLSKPKRTSAGSVKEMKICAHNAKGSEIRFLFGLRSSNFDLKYDKKAEKFIFNVKGYGHGVGMSQRGANYMAQHGSDYKEILNHYYPGTVLRK